MSERRKGPCPDQVSGARTLGLGEYVALLPSEPFRIFFPLGLAVGICGVSLWPLFYAGVIDLYPAVAHSRLMISFVGAFVIGFLGTAAPRELGAPRLLGVELVALVALYVGAVMAQCAGSVVGGDVLFLGFISTFALVLAARVVARTTAPPAGAVLVGMGIACAVVGAYLMAVETRVELTVFRYRIARLLLFEGFLLLPIMGVGGFLFPRFFGGRGDAVARLGGGRPGFVFATVCGAGVLGSLLLDGSGWMRSGAMLRAVFAGGYLLAAVPQMFRSGRGPGTMVWCLRAALGAALLGLLLAPLFPTGRVGVSHLLYVTGFGLMALAVGARVLSGHAGELEIVTGKVRAMRWVLLLAVLAAGTRAVADLVPKIRISHHIYAAICWIALTAIWAVVFLPKIRRAEDDRVGDAAPD